MLGSPARGAIALRADAAGLGAALGDVVWMAVTAGTALAASPPSRFSCARGATTGWPPRSARSMALRAALDRTEALLDADDQRTIVWDIGRRRRRRSSAACRSASARPPTRPRSSPSRPGSARKARRSSKRPPTSSAARARRFRSRSRRCPARCSRRPAAPAAGARSLRLRELTGERRSFAELKEQAIFVVNEMTALRALADLLPFPLWRRNRIGRLTWVNAAYVRAVEAASQEAVLTLRHRAAAVAHARGDPRGGARRRSLSRQRHRHRRRRPAAPAGPRHADRGRHDRLRHRRLGGRGGARRAEAR